MFFDDQYLFCTQISFLISFASLIEHVPPTVSLSLDEYGGERCRYFRVIFGRTTTIVYLLYWRQELLLGLEAFATWEFLGFGA